MTDEDTSDPGTETEGEEEETGEEKSESEENADEAADDGDPPKEDEEVKVDDGLVHDLSYYVQKIAKNQEENDGDVAAEEPDLVFASDSDNDLEVGQASCYFLPKMLSLDEAFWCLFSISIIFIFSAANWRGHVSAAAHAVAPVHRKEVGGLSRTPIAVVQNRVHGTTQVSLHILVHPYSRNNDYFKVAGLKFFLFEKMMSEVLDFLKKKLILSKKTVWHSSLFGRKTMSEQLSFLKKINSIKEKSLFSLNVSLKV